MKEIFHCTPAELAEIDHVDVEVHWAIREAIRQEQDRETKKTRKRYNK